MSVTGLADYKKLPSHRRENSGEIDVFEAAGYYNDNFALVDGANMTPKMVMKDEGEGYLRGRRISLDMPSFKHYHFNHPVAQPHNQHHQQQQQQQQQLKSKEKKYKQPSSPGGKLAHFLNSLFNQTSSKKKKSSKSSSQSMKDEDENPSGRRKRRSSISHFRSSSSVVDAKSIYSSSSSGFRTPPPYSLNTPIKSYKDFRRLSDHKDVLATQSKHSTKGNGNGNGNPKKQEKIRGSNLDWADEYVKFRGGFSEKPKNKSNQGYENQKNRGIQKFNEGLDDGAESDSSSDLFELQIDYKFGFCSSGLPVYETTHMDTIKRVSANAITNGPIKN